MNGIPIDIRIDGDTETIYLATRASGAKGKAMMAAKRAFHTASQAAARALMRVHICGSRAMGLDPKAATYGAELGKLADEQDDFGNRADGFRAAALDASINLVRMSLEENYGPDQAERYLNVMTDSEISECVGIIETGDVPENFMKSRGIQRNGSSTTPADDGPAGSSSATDSLPDNSDAAN